MLAENWESKGSLRAEREKGLAPGAFLLTVLDFEDAFSHLAFEYVFWRDMLIIFQVQRCCFSLTAFC